MVEALYDWNAVQPDDLAMNKGDIITITRRQENDGWWEGELNGEMGYFPSNYVKVRSDIHLIACT